MLRTLIPLLCLVVTLPGCQPGRTGGALVSPELGLSGHYTRQVLLTDEVHHVLMGHVIVATQAGHTTRALVITQRRDGVHRLRISAAWRGGAELDWRRLPHASASCTHGHCRDRVLGMIVLSPQMVQAAARTGFRARLIGSTGAIDILAPPALFAEALTRSGLP